jgi:hypothetical protein
VSKITERARQGATIDGESMRVEEPATTAAPEQPAAQVDPDDATAARMAEAEAGATPDHF